MLPVTHYSIVAATKRDDVLSSVSNLPKDSDWSQTSVCPASNGQQTVARAGCQ